VCRVSVNVLRNLTAAGTAAVMWSWFPCLHRHIRPAHTLISFTRSLVYCVLFWMFLLPFTSWKLLEMFCS